MTAGLAIPTTTSPTEATGQYGTINPSTETPKQSRIHNDAPLHKALKSRLHIGHGNVPRMLLSWMRSVLPITAAQPHELRFRHQPEAGTDSNMASITVIGGTGFTGSHIAREAAHRGHTVTSISRHRPPSPQAQIEYSTGDAVALVRANLRTTDV